MLAQALALEVFGSSVLHWAYAALGVAIVTLAQLLVRQLVIARLQHSAPKTDTLLDDLVLDLSRRTSTAFALAMGVATATWILTLPPPMAGYVHTAVLLIAIVQAGMWGTGLVQFILIAVVDRRTDPEDRAAKTGRNMLRFVGMMLVWSGVFLIALDNLGINITTLIAGLGVTGVAVALATQNIVGDLFASVSILLDKPFLVGDFIAVDTFVGVVERIGVRSTRLRSLSGELAILANSDLTKSRIRNYKHMLERRVVFGFTLRFETPLEALTQVPEMVRQSIVCLPRVRFDRAHLQSLGEYGYVYEVVFYVLAPDYNLFMDTQQEIYHSLLRRFAERDIALAYRAHVIFDGGKLQAPAIVAARPAARAS